MDPRIEFANSEWKLRCKSALKHMPLDQLTDLNHPIFEKILNTANKHGLIWEAEFPAELQSKFAQRSTLLEMLDCFSQAETTLDDIYDPDFRKIPLSKRTREFEEIKSLARRLDQKLWNEKNLGIEAYEHVFSDHIEILLFTKALKRLAEAEPVAGSGDFYDEKYYMLNAIGRMVAIACAATGNWSELVLGKNKPWAFLISLFRDVFGEMADCEPDRPLWPYETPPDEFDPTHLLKKVFQEPPEYWLPNLGSSSQ